jgi:hypothetical protein
MNILLDIEIQLTRDVSKFEREIKIRQQMSSSRSQQMFFSRRRYLSFSQIITQIESREIRETRKIKKMRETEEMRKIEEMKETEKMRKIRKMRKTRKIKKKNEKIKMIEKIDEKQFRNNSDDVNIKDENKN